MDGAGECHVHYVAEFLGHFGEEFKCASLSKFIFIFDIFCGSKHLLDLYCFVLSSSPSSDTAITLEKGHVLSLGQAEPAGLVSD